MEAAGSLDEQGEEMLAKVTEELESLMSQHEAFLEKERALQEYVTCLFFKCRSLLAVV